MSSSILHFLERLRMLSSVHRYGTVPTMIKESVSEHTFNVTFMALVIADHEDGKVNVESLLRKCLVHDFVETRTGDIPHAIKHRFDEGSLGEILEDVESRLIEGEIFAELPEPVRKKYISSSKSAKDGIEGRIVKAADAMDVVMTAIRELNMGNRYFEHIYDRGLELLKEHSDLRFVKTFLSSVGRYRKGQPYIDDKE